MESPAPRQPPRVGRWPDWISRSYTELTGDRLVVAPDDTALYTVRAVVLCHNTEPDPTFVFANLAAQRLWQRDWDSFIGWPSRLTAPSQERPGRARVLAGADLVRGYSGIRVDASGRLFRIFDAVVWRVSDSGGRAVGQAATFENWEYLDASASLQGQ